MISRTWDLNIHGNQRIVETLLELTIPSFKALKVKIERFCVIWYVNIDRSPSARVHQVGKEIF